MNKSQATKSTAREKSHFVSSLSWTLNSAEPVHWHDSATSTDHTSVHKTSAASLLDTRVWNGPKSCAYKINITGHLQALVLPPLFRRTLETMRFVGWNTTRANITCGLDCCSGGMRSCSITRGDSVCPISRSDAVCGVVLSLHVIRLVAVCDSQGPIV